MTGQDIDTVVVGLLQDAGGVTWAAADRLNWLNMGMLEIATLKPKATTATTTIDITAGTARQAKPAGCIQVLDLLCNMGADGNTPGRPITVVERDRLAAAVPSWRSAIGAAIKHVVFDDRDKDYFYVYPAIKTGPWKVEAMVHQQPTPVTDLVTVLPIGNEYKNALVEYVMHMAYAQDAENVDNLQVSAAHYSKFGQILGVQVAKQKKAAAAANAPVNPSYPAVDKNAA